MMAEGNTKSIFSRRTNGSGGLRLPNFGMPRSSSSRRENGNRFVSGNGRFNVREIAHQIENHGSVEFEFAESELWATKPPKPFQKPYGSTKDSYDMHDVNLPWDESTDVPSPGFSRCVRSVLAYPVNVNDMEPVTTDGGVHKRVVQEGTGAPDQVKDGCRVWIHYETYLDKGKQLVFHDSTSHHRMATSLEIGNEGLPGLNLGLKTMRKGEVAELAISSLYAYGTQGICGFIGKNQALRMIVELKEVKNSHTKPIAFMTEAEKQTLDITLKDVVTEVDHLLKAGNVKFEKQLHRDACDRYNWALDLFKDHENLSNGMGKSHNRSPDEDVLVDQKKFQIYSNLALCLLHLEYYGDAENACESALKLQHQRLDLRPKVIYRQAKAMYKQGKFNDAIRTCQVGLRSTSWGHSEFRDLKFRAETGLRDEISHAEKRMGRF